MKAVCLRVKIAFFALVASLVISQAFPGVALCQSPQPDDDSLRVDSGAIDSLSFCDGINKPDDDGIIKFPANQPGCPCVWWHVATQIGMCGPCDPTCDRKPRDSSSGAGSPPAE